MNNLLRSLLVLLPLLFTLPSQAVTLNDQFDLALSAELVSDRRFSR